MRRSTVRRPSVPTLAILGLALCCAAPAAATGKAAPPAAKSKFVSGKKVLTLERFAPAKPGKYPLVLLLHGLDGPDKFGDLYRGAAQRLAHRGYVVGLPHYFEATDTGTEQAAALLKPFRSLLSGGPADHSHKDHLVGLFKSWQQAVRDAVQHLRQDPQVQPKRVGLVAMSLGAFLALSVAADEEQKIAAVVSFFGGLPSGLDVKHLPPTLIIHGGKDDIVPVSQAEQLHGVLQKRKVPTEKVIYPDSGHMFVGADGQVHCWDALAAELKTHQFLDDNI